MSEAAQPSEGELILYQTPEGAVRIEVLHEAETFWLNQRKIAELFGVDVRTVSEHLANIFATGELAPAATVRKIRRVQTEGTRDCWRSESSWLDGPSSQRPTQATPIPCRGG